MDIHRRLLLLLRPSQIASDLGVVLPGGPARMRGAPPRPRPPRVATARDPPAR